MMFKLICILGFLGLVSGNTGCGHSADSNSTSLTYELEENGCKTEKHEFSSQQDMCDGLRSESLNHRCAYGLRSATFKQSCPGQEFTLTD
jgi:hypothetical protein